MVVVVTDVETIIVIIQGHKGAVMVDSGHDLTEGKMLKMYYKLHLKNSLPILLVVRLKR